MSLRLRLFILWFAALFLFAPALQGQFYYGIRQDFGKNRVQYNDFDWVYFRFDAYDVYFYRGNEELARSVARLTAQHLPQIENYLDAPLDERIQILVFNSLSDLKQSNVNSSSEEDYNTGGVTRTSGRRLFVHFNGDHQELEKHLRMGLAEVVLNNLLYGSFTRSVTNSALLNLPPWYVEGLISFMGQSWSPELETRTRDGFYSNKYKRINTLTELDAREAGHSFWYYLAETYGDKIIRNIVYMSVVNRDVESGFLYILGRDLKQISAGWKEFYRERYAAEAIAEQLAQKPLRKARKGRSIEALSSSPDGRYLAWVEQRFQKYRVYLYDRERDKKTKILQHGYRIAQNADYSYPLLAWHPGSQRLAILTEEQGFIYLHYYETEEDEITRKPFFRFDKILSLSYSPDGKQFLLSAVQKGQSDIFLYTILNTKIEAITRDSYDDLEPCFFDGAKRIAWSSNRPIDSLYPNAQSPLPPQEGFDLFAAPAEALGQDSVALWRLTQSPGINERRPQLYQPAYLSFFSDRDGPWSQHLIAIDSSVAYVDTITHYDYRFSEYRLAQENLSPVARDFAPEQKTQYSVHLLDQRYRLYREDFIPAEDLGLELIASRSALGAQAAPSPRPSQKAKPPTPDVSLLPLYYPGLPRDSLALNIRDYRFRGESKAASEDSLNRPAPEAISLREKANAAPRNPARENAANLEIPPIRNYFLSFYQEDFTVRFDNRFDNPQYQPFTGFVSGDLLNQGFNTNFKVGVMDLMHDYRITAGMRTTFQPLNGTSLAPNAEFMLGVSDYKKRLDRHYTYQRRSQVQFLDVTNFRRYIINELNARTVYPFNPVSSLHASLGYRLDEEIRLARDFNNLDESIGFTDYLIARLAYIHDDSRKLGLNQRAGLRYKVFTEYYRRLERGDYGLHTLGLDARHYSLLHRNLIWANRLATGTSFGPQKLIHIMGGTDNEFTPNFEPTTPIAQDNNYLFQTLVTNMRGFFQNVRNGNSFTVINSELRWPIVSYLANRPLRSDFLNNLMIVGFGDLGTAWNGPSPWDRQNAINTIEFPLGTEGRIVLDSQRNPIILGTGLGLRSRLFGYYVRVDYAWGIQDGIILDPLFHFSIGTDF